MQNLSFETTLVDVRYTWQAEEGHEPEMVECVKVTPEIVEAAKNKLNAKGITEKSILTLEDWPLSLLANGKNFDHSYGWVSVEKAKEVLDTEIQTPSLDWNTVTNEQAAQLFTEAFEGKVNVLPSAECLRQLRKATKFNHQAALSFVENDDVYEMTIYSLVTPGGLPLYMDIDAETGDTSVGF